MNEGCEDYCEDCGCCLDCDDCTPKGCYCFKTGCFAPKDCGCTGDALSGLIPCDEHMDDQ